MRQRRRGTWMLLLALAALALALGIIIVRASRPVNRLTLTAGPLGTTRALVASYVVDALRARGKDARLVETSHTEEELARVDSGVVDFALISEIYGVGRHPSVREVAPLYVEALHLLVKRELAEATTQSLGALGGRTVGLGPSGSASAGLATAVLEFAGVTAGNAGMGDGYVPRHLSLEETRALARADRTALPDAILHLATVPSRVAMELIGGADYRLVGLPFADAFRLNALIADQGPDDAVGRVDGRHVSDTVIPAFTYGAEPAIPAAPLHTIGARLVLIANERVSSDAVQLVLDTVFSSEIALIAHPPLDRGVLAMPYHLERHAGTSEYLQRDQPYVTHDTVGSLSNSLSVLGALAGGVLFFWQWRRRRTQAAQDETFGTYMLRIADVERRLAGLELSATLELEPLAALQREVLTLKSEALERFTAGELGSQAALADLLGPLNAARDHIGVLVLHVRSSHDSA